MVLTGRAGALAAAGSALVGVVSGVFHLPGWLGIAAFEGALGCGIAVDALRAGSVRDLAFVRGGDSTVRLGESATVGLDVVNAGDRQLRGTLRDSWTPSAGNLVRTAAPRHVASPAREPRHELSIAAHGTLRVESVLTPTRRGDRAPDRVTVRSLGPLGLAGRQISRVVPWRLRVLPPFESRKHLPSRLARLHETDGRTPVLVRGQGSEFDSLREYVVGDDVRSIDWRATARRNDVVVRTWRPERDRHVVIVLDTSRASAGRVGDVPRLDSAIDAALLLTALATRAGDRVDLLAYDQRLRASVTGALPGRTLALFSDAMAVLEPSLIELNAEALVAHLTKRIRRPSLVVLLTSIDAATIGEGLLPQVRRLTGRHRVLVGSVADPRVAQLASARGDADAVFAAASAELTLSTRRQVAALLGRHGVEVVDAVPERLAPALADRYLALKAAGRL
ncbi:DUF58 domain-containing protein [Actinocrinis puniceicyclus]|uniref:DUF58 domain-containing protein n=1 Tax=Actinocrinis puniceicyclus TaxID=977794 RepID=A0A8J7WL81_9ACTN|nr:DUF58 domain-containing protein [Actinocrinis puniceicyclus]